MQSYRDVWEITMMYKHKFRGLESILTFDNWPTLLFGRLFDRKTGFVAYRKKGFDILIDHRGGDECGTRMCIAADTYRKYLPFFNLKGPVRVLDLGANGGGFPLMLRIAGIDVVRAVCVEMNPLTFLRLHVNLATNLGPSAVAINAAVCGMPEDSKIMIAPSRGGTGDSMFAERATRADGTVQAASQVAVPTTTLQALYDRYFNGESIDICKIDIEGAEFDIFESSSSELLQKIKGLIMEIHCFDEAGRARAKVLLDRITTLGFEDITIDEGHKTGDGTEVRAFVGPAAKRAAVPGRSAA
jgi:FkbM family methyltransferase